MGFWSSTPRTRRKPHRCETCGQTVKVGEISFDEAGTYDGDFNSYKQCRPCNEMVRYFYWRGTFGDGEGWLLYELADTARDEGLLWPPVWNFVNED